MTALSNVTASERQHVISNLSSFDEEIDALHILLVEDDYSDMLMTLQSINAAAVPYELSRVTHGDEVIPYLMNAMQERLPDIIMLDMGLPGTNGFEILEALSESSALMRSVPIVIITMYENFDYLKRTFDLPIYGYLTKPVNVSKMKEILDKVACFAEPIRE